MKRVGTQEYMKSSLGVRNAMTREAVTRQFFIDFLENLGDNSGRHEQACDFYDEEDANMILVDMFFAGQLELKWNSETHKLMIKPCMVIQYGNKHKLALKRGDS